MPRLSDGIQRLVDVNIYTKIADDYVEAAEIAERRGALQHASNYRRLAGDLFMDASKAKDAQDREGLRGKSTHNKQVSTDLWNEAMKKEAR